MKNSATRKTREINSLFDYAPNVSRETTKQEDKQLRVPPTKENLRAYYKGAL